MSLGYGVGDVIAVSTLARNVWGRFRDAPNQFKAIQNEVANLCLVLDDIENNLSGLQVTDKQTDDLPKLMEGCRSVLDDTKKLIQKNESLGAESSGLSSKTHKAWKKLNWDSATVNELRDRMVSNAIYLNAFNTSLASRVSRATNDIVEVVAEDVQSLVLNQSQQEREAVLEWISPLNFGTQQSDLSGRRQKGTGSWLLESQDFQEWVNKEGKTLVCQGMPGAGKTMLASLVIDHLQEVFAEEKVAIAYMYCDYKRQDEQTPINLIASITKQLLQQQNSIPGGTLKMYQHHHEKKTRPNFEELLEMTRSSIALFSRLYIIVDALDELGNAGQVRQTLIGSLRPLQNLHHFNLMTTSRYIPSLALEFHQPLCMDIRASAEDVRRYVEGHILDLPSCVRKNLGLQETIISAIVDAVEGMFLLAQLHMDSLRDKTSAKLVKKALEILPKGSNALDLAYDGAMQRVEDQMEGFRLRAKQLLGWLTYSERLMTVKELQHALAIEPGTPEFDEDSLVDIDEVLDFCAGLVIVDEETQIIRLVHYTTQEYFRRNGGKILASAQQDLAISCLTYLLYEKFGSGWVVGEVGQEADLERDEDEDAYENEDEDEDEDEDENFSNSVEARVQKYPFLEYAAKYWATHARVCEQRNVKKLTMSFMKDDSRVSSAGQVMLALDRDPYREDIDDTNSHSPLSAMHIIAYLGYEEMISELLNHGFEADVKDSAHRTPLWWAALQGHKAVVDLLLLQNRVNVNSRGLVHSKWRGQVSTETPLGIAAMWGRDRVVNLLIQREDVDVNFPDKDGISPLSIAIEGQHSAVVELLLTRKDIDVNSRDQFGQTPLSFAAVSGQENIIEQLLKHKDIPTTSVCNNGSSPLALTAYQGHADTVENSLGRSDIGVNTKDKYGRTPLMLAMNEGYEAVVKLLLSHPEVEVNLKDKEGITALHRAARWGFALIVKHLLSRADIEVNSKDNFGRTALNLAARLGHNLVVEVLLGCVGVDVNLEDEAGRTPLHRVAERGREAAMTLLLGHVGIEVNPKDHEGKTPLAQAIISHHAAAVKRLCAHSDVDLDPRDNEGRDVFALVKEERERSSRFEKERARITLELDECMDILRTAIERRSRKEPQTSEAVPA